MKSGLRCRKSFAMTREFFAKQLKIPSKQPEVVDDKGDLTNTNMDKKVKVEKVDPRLICIRTAFRPLGLVAKCFGLFPCYNLSFKLDPKANCKKKCPKVKLMQALEIMYSGLILAILVAASINCIVKPPTAFLAMSGQDGDDDDTTDYYVVMATMYGQLSMGILSLFIFPKNFCTILHYIDHFAHVDKILRFSAANQEREQRVGRIIVRVLFVILTSSAMLYAGMFLLEDYNAAKCYTDWMMIGVLTLAQIVQAIPTAMLLFFLHGIKLRFQFFNEKMEKLILPITPSCFACNSYADYAEELNGQVCPRKCNTLAEDLEKMRVLHEELSGLIDETSNVFGSHILRDYVFCIGGLILNTYFIILLADIEYWFLYVPYSLYLVIKLLLVSGFSNNVTTECTSSLRVLNKASLSQLTSDCSFQIQIFIRKLHNTRAVTAAGFFVVNRSMVSSILGAITTYFIILVQFKVTDYSGALKGLARC